MLIVIPGLSAPGKLWLPPASVTFMSQSLATLLPPPSLTTCLMTVNEAGRSSLVMVQV
jgi:hypothetical protein